MAAEHLKAGLEETWESLPGFPGPNPKGEETHMHPTLMTRMVTSLLRLTGEEEGCPWMEEQQGRIPQEGVDSAVL